MTRVIHGVEVSGIDVDVETRCAHYHGERDIIAIKFSCCCNWFPCHQCHSEVARHPTTVWRKEEFDTVAVLCGGCGQQFTVRQYLACDSVCPQCRRSFNPRCADHYHFYFDVAPDQISNS